jgi:nucleotide-binding universal stress UspA family protein
LINPLKSEADAFRFTLIVVGLAAPVILVAVIWSSTAAVGVGLGLLLGLFVGLFILKRDEPEEKMLLGRPRQGDDRRRILVVANETLTGEALRQEIAHRMRGQEADVFVVCPALNVSRIKHWVSDEDEARRQAQERLDSVVARLAREGVAVDGDIGDGDPMQAMEDALRLFPAHEMIVSTHPLGRSHWLERGVVERARERFPIPVTHVVVDLEREREFVAQRGASPDS